METIKPKYQEMLLEEYESRCKRNPAYSLRAYARDLNLSPTSLSLILKGKQGLSSFKAKNISDKIGFSEPESQLFCTSVQSCHARSPRARESADVQLRKETFSSTELSLEYFKIISDWYHFAILELTDTKGFKSEPKWIAKKLGISTLEATSAIERLLRLELLTEEKGKLKQTTGYLATPSGIPNRSLKNFHHQLLKKADQAIADQDVKEREVASVILAMDKSDLEWAREEMKNFRRSLLKRLSQKTTKDSLYCFSMQMFNLEQKESA